jgi:hypothetical protein
MSGASSASGQHVGHKLLQIGQAESNGAQLQLLLQDGEKIGLDY